MFGKYLDEVRKEQPLIHCITNYVTVNDVANVLLAAGGSPVMADEEQEVEDITSIAKGLVINIGTLNARSIPAMKKAAAKAEALGHPMVLDPVGAGASALRTKTAIDLADHYHFSVIRGNVSEIRTLASGSGHTHGVDAAADDKVTEDNLDQMVSFVKKLAADTDSIISMSGAIDLVSDSQKCFVIRNGRSEMGKITGTGCQLTALTCAFVSVDHSVEAAAAAVAMMGLAGEKGWSYMQKGDGNSTYRNRIIDAIYNMTAAELDKGEKYEIR